MNRAAGDPMQRELVALLPRLRRFARGLAGSIDAADDLVQAACERALANRAQWQPGSRLDSWMFRIVQNLWIDRTRSEARWRPAGEEQLAAVPANDMMRAVEARLELQRVRVAIDALPPEQRTVLMLVTVEGLSYREAAVILEIPLGTVMSRLARARIALLSPAPTAGGSATQRRVFP